MQTLLGVSALWGLSRGRPLDSPKGGETPDKMPLILARRRRSFNHAGGVARSAWALTLAPRSFSCVADFAVGTRDDFGTTSVRLPLMFTVAQHFRPVLLRNFNESFIPDPFSFYRSDFFISFLHIIQGAFGSEGHDAACQPLTSRLFYSIICCIYFIYSIFC